MRSYLHSRCAAYRFHVADPIPFQESIVVDMDHGHTNQVQTDYSSVAYWYQAEPHVAMPELPPVSERLPTPTGQNALQIALASSPLWAPAALVGLKALGKCVRGRKQRGAQDTDTGTGFDHTRHMVYTMTTTGSVS